MTLSSRIFDRFLSIGLYTLLAVGMIGFGNRLINHALDTRFYNEYLSQWEMALMAFRHQAGDYPVFTGGNHQKYMELLVEAMNLKAVTVPMSNTRLPFSYKIDKVGAKAETVFLLALDDRIVLYNLPPKTVRMLDKTIDGRLGLDSGALTGMPSKDGMTYIGIWRLS